MEKETFRLNGKLIRKLREQMPIGRAEFSKLCDLHPDTIKEIESGVRKQDGRPTVVSNDTVVAIQRALNNIPREEIILVESSSLEKKIPESIGRCLCSFEALIDDCLRDYVPRQTIETQLNAFLNSEPSGYFVIKGDPGMGKSTVMAHLARSCGYIHHFNIAADRRNAPTSFMNNVCARLIIEFDLGHSDISGDSHSRANDLLSLLIQAKAKQGGEEKLVILVDALDEANWKPFGSENVLDLPVTLPAGVYIIATTRRLHALDPRSRLVVRPMREIVLDKDSDWQQRDAEAYIKKLSSLPGVASWIKNNRLTPPSFTKLLLDKSEANFMYLRHVLAALGDATDGGMKLSSSLTPDDFPQGLREYYAKHWYIMQTENSDVHEKLFKPILCVLGVSCLSVKWTNVTFEF